jgi:hypothetical protein
VCLQSVSVRRGLGFGEQQTRTGKDTRASWNNGHPACLCGEALHGRLGRIHDMWDGFKEGGHTGILSLHMFNHKIQQGGGFVFACRAHHNLGSDPKARWGKLNPTRGGMGTDWVGPAPVAYRAHRPTWSRT